MNTATEHRRAIENFEWLEPFSPHRWLRGGWLQTLSIKLLRPALDVNQWAGMQVIRIADDGDPTDTMTGYYLPPQPETGKPTVILIHGMGGHAKSGYMRSLAKALLDNGYGVILWNNRGAGDSAKCCVRFHHPGLADDVRRLVNDLHEYHPTCTKSGLAAIAFSLGANVLLRYLAESGQASRLQACVAISAPLDMKITSMNLRKGMNKLFDKYLLTRQQAELLRENSDLTEDERETIENAASVWELDNQFTGPRFGYAGAEEYYAANSAIHVLADVETPTLLLHAADDPVVTPDVFEQPEWAPEGPLYPALSHSGGHTGFLSCDGTRWHEQACVGFLERCTA